MIGHVILQKSFEGEDILKVSGGRLLPNGSRGALVDEVKRGSIADLEGHILPGEYPTFFSTWPHTCLPLDHFRVLVWDATFFHLVSVLCSSFDWPPLTVPSPLSFLCLIVLMSMKCTHYLSVYVPMLQHPQKLTATLIGMCRRRDYRVEWPPLARKERARGARNRIGHSE